LVRISKEEIGMDGIVLLFVSLLVSIKKNVYQKLLFIFPLAEFY